MWSYDKNASNAAPDIHSPLRIFSRPVMYVPQVHWSINCERSSIRKQNFSKEWIVYHLMGCKLTKCQMNMK